MKLPFSALQQLTCPLSEFIYEVEFIFFFVYIILQASGSSVAIPKYLDVNNLTKIIVLI